MAPAEIWEVSAEPDDEPVLDIKDAQNASLQYIAAVSFSGNAAIDRVAPPMQSYMESLTALQPSKKLL